jgi:predicted nuclease of predicted toxin-antitoxin system
VLSVREAASRADDATVVAMALQEGRVVITEDKDFGHLVYAQLRSFGGVMLLRFPENARQSKRADVLEAVERLGNRLIGAFVVLTPGQVRVGRSPAE